MEPTVQAHVVEGEDGRPAGGSRAMEGHVQDTVRGLDAVLLQRDHTRQDSVQGSHENREVYLFVH